MTDRCAHGRWVEAAAHQEHADSLEGPSVSREWAAAEVSLKGVTGALGLGPWQCLVLGCPFGFGVLSAVRLDHVAADSVLPKLRFDHTKAAWRMTVSLLAPPSGKGGVIHVPELRKAIERRLHQRLPHP